MVSVGNFSSGRSNGEGGVEESCDTKEPEKRRLIGREENLQKKGKGRKEGLEFGSFGTEDFYSSSFFSS